MKNKYVKKKIVFDSPKEIIEHISYINDKFSIYNISIKLLSREESNWITLPEIKIDDINFYVVFKGKVTSYYPISLIEEVTVRYKEKNENGTLSKYEEKYRVNPVYLEFYLHKEALSKLNSLDCMRALK